MRYGQCDGNVILSTGGGLVDYDAAFLPHWKEFANALEEYQYALNCLHGSKLSIWTVHLPKPVLDLLSHALESTHFTSLSLHDNRFGRDGIQFALDYMQNNPVLEDFVMFRNQINHEDDVKRLCEVIKDHPTINTLDLDECCGEDTDGHEMLCSIMDAGRNKLKSINFPRNRISTGGSTFIGDFLATNPSTPLADILATNPILKELHLDDNRLDDKDATSIASALKHNTNLRCLGLLENEITDSGLDALRKAEFDPASLNSAYDSNHTCHIYGVSRFNGSWSHRLEPKQVRQKKIYHILSERNRECSQMRERMKQRMKQRMM